MIQLNSSLVDWIPHIRLGPEETTQVPGTAPMNAPVPTPQPGMSTSRSSPFPGCGLLIAAPLSVPMPQSKCETKIERSHQPRLF